MYIKIIICIIALAISIMEAVAQQDSVRTLEDCIALAIENNPELHQGELRMKANDLNYRQAKRSLLPNLDASYNHRISTGRDVDPTTNLFVEETVNSGGMGLSSNLVLFDGLRMFHEIRRRSSAKEAGKLEFDGQTNELKLDVITAYIRVLTAQDVLSQSEKQFEVTKENLRREEVLFKEGANEPGSYYDLKGEYSLNLNTIEQNKQLLNNSQVELAQLLNISKDKLGTLAQVSIPSAESFLSDQELFDVAKSTLPQFKAWDWRIQESENVIKSTKSAFFPSVSLGAGLSTNYSNLNDLSVSSQLKNFLGRYIGINLNIPIFNRFNTSTQVKLAKLDLQDLKYQKQTALNTLRANTSKAVFDLHVTQSNIQNLEQQEQNFAESFRIAQVQFDLGASNSVIYLTAKNRYENAQNQLIVKRYEWLLQKYINDFYAGKLEL